MTLFLEDRGWVIDLVERPVESRAKPRAVHQAIPDDREVDQKIRGAALRMTLESSTIRISALSACVLASWSLMSVLIKLLLVGYFHDIFLAKQLPAI